MSKLEYPQCPYCGTKLSFMNSGRVVKNPKYKCETCEETSLITVKHGIYGLFRMFGIIICALVILSVFFARFYYLAINLILLTFIACFVLLPFYAKLVKEDDCEANKKVEENTSEEK